jgi:hypothetical protein
MAQKKMEFQYVDMRTNYDRQTLIDFYEQLMRPSFGVSS